MTYTIIFPKKTKAPKARKPRVNKSKEIRTFPKYREGMSTLDYVAAYHAANSTVNLTTVSYVCL